VGLSELPDGSGDRHARAFCRLGWERKPKEGKGSHIIVAKGGLRLSIPAHPSVKRTVLAKLLKQGGISVADYVRAYRGR
jgi:hypothetical protein